MCIETFSHFGVIYLDLVIALKSSFLQLYLNTLKQLIEYLTDVCKIKQNKNKMNLGIYNFPELLYHVIPLSSVSAFPFCSASSAVAAAASSGPVLSSTSDKKNEYDKNKKFIILKVYLCFVFGPNF